MKISRLGTVSLLVLATSTIAGGWFGDRVLAGGGQLNDHLRLYTAMLSTIQEHYADQVDPEDLVSSSIEEMLHTLDPHSNFLEIRAFSNLQERQKGSYYGLGITVQSIDGNITVVAPFEGTPAFRLGIRAGDVISRIEGGVPRAVRFRSRWSGRAMRIPSSSRSSGTRSPCTRCPTRSWWARTPGTSG